MENVPIEVSWTEEVCNALNRYQRLGLMHPFTCDNHNCRGLAPDFGVLVAKEDGWHCPTCDYRQYWAHQFMIEIGMKSKKQLREEGHFVFEPDTEEDNVDVSP
jgi:hypothetical protein